MIAFEFVATKMKSTFFELLEEIIMYRVHYIFTPKDMTKMADAIDESAAIWKKHGCPEISVWQLSGSAMGQMSFTVAFENAGDFGACVDKVVSDPDFIAWQGKYFGISDWAANTHARLYKKF